ncbi:MAG TPA: asparagine synthase (glutamine-hydrolyzing) [Kofleriaceae bacterium]|nr:asparagine synthase (glutamine-hydrolyzing) [Kofleriaceae bacterium]
MEGGGAARALGGALAAIAALAHRGPDGRGVWRSTDGRVALGHARLAVVDPDGGAQPIANEDGSIVAVVNGELYGHDEHARWLAARGHRLRSRCDAEVLVHLYEELGDELVQSVRGELAFALWDGRRRRLLAGRDRFGIKPLVWARWRGGVALASEAKALLALGVPARWDDEAFFHAAHTQYLWPDRTLFTGVAQLEPGTILAWDGGEPRLARYWELPAGCEVTCESVDDAAARLREALDDAVAVRLRADARVCVQLSGGIDSTAVAALAARRGGVSGAFTVAWAGGAGTGVDRYDERAIAAATARALGLPHTVVELDGAAIAATWPEAVAHGEGLAINGHLAGKWLLSRAMRDAGYKVALTGEGADELFAGYPHLRVDAGAGAAARYHAPSSGVMLPAGEGLPTDGVQAHLGCVPTWIAAKATLGRRVRQLLAPELRRSFAGVDPFAELAARLGGGRLVGAPALHVAAATWAKTALAQYILRTLGDGMEMAHGIEGRVPFLDHRIAELAFAIAPRVLAGGAVDKPVLRWAVRDVVPAAVLERPKHPFLAPPLARLAPALVQDTLRAYAQRSPLVDGPRLVEVLDQLSWMTEAELQGWDAALMLILSAAILQARYRA